VRNLITKTYQETVSIFDCEQELKDSLKFKERVPSFIQNIETEIKKLPKHLQTKKNIEETVRDLTGLFLRSIETQAKERLLSDAVKNTLKDKQSKKIKEETLIDDMIEGKEIDAERIAEVAE